MSDLPSYYAKKIQDLQESQVRIYRGWLDSQHQIFEGYMGELQNMLNTLQRTKPKLKIKKRRAKRPTRKVKRAKAKAKAKAKTKSRKPRRGRK